MGPTIRASISVPRKQFQASSGVQTIGSPRTLKDVLMTSGQPVRCRKASIMFVIERVRLPVHRLHARRSGPRA